MKLNRITGERIADGIFGFLEENNISLATMRGQGYDGASNMSSDRVGVQARIRHKASLATYVHCSGHCLTLVISKSCALPEVRNVIDCVKKCSRFFLNSPKRSGVLEMFFNHNVVNEERRKALIDLCKTRWAERHSAYRHFYQGYVFVVEALEMIAFRYHLEKYGATYADWDYAGRNEAQQILASVTSFQFVVVFVTIYQYLSHLSGITVKLQSKAVDIVKAHNMISEIVRTYNSERANVESSFSQIYKVSSDMAIKVESTIAMPRIAARQQYSSCFCSRVFAEKCCNSLS